ncbi:MAG: helix-turn-helix transcriptional regulator [Nocardioides sp.]
MAGIGNDLVREARKRAGLTQRELAERAGTTQSAIARLERGRSTPSFDAVIRLVRACGLDLHVALLEYDDSDWMLALDALRMSPSERIAYAVDMANTMNRIQGAATRGVA